MRIVSLAVVLSLSAGCVWVGESDWQARVDVDGDGAFALDVGGLDCDDLDPEVRPNAVEVCNGIDDDCDGSVDGGLVRLRYLRDADGDGYGDPEQESLNCSELPGFVQADVGDPEDCNDARAEIHPGAEDAWYDGIDSNCDGADDFDQDGDGYANKASGGADCDDLDPGRNPDVAEIWYDGVDQNCDGADDYDQDGDGFAQEDDCNDTSAAIYPGAPEIWYDGVDQDCDNGSDFDQDGDGSVAVQGFGEDCDDTDPSVFPAAVEIWYDGVDQDCDEGDDYDQDGDGFRSDAYGGEDCDDTTVNVGPDEGETCNDRDDDCNGLVDDIDTYWRDADGDGAGLNTEVVLGCVLPDGYVAAGSLNDVDCDDSDPLTYPGAPPVCGDWVDNDCGTDTEGCVGLRPIWPRADISSASFGREAGSTGDTNDDGVVDLWIGGRGAESRLSDGRARLDGFRGPFNNGAWGESSFTLLASENAEDAIVRAFDVDFGPEPGGQVMLVQFPFPADPSGGEAIPGKLWLVDPKDVPDGVHDLDDEAAAVLTLPGEPSSIIAIRAVPSSRRDDVWLAFDGYERFGLMSGWPSSASPWDDAELIATWTGENGTFLSGVDMADVDGDGVEDLVSGSSWYGGPFDGALLLTLGPLSAEIELPVDQDARLEDPRGNDGIGHSFCLLDHDGDGRLEVADPGTAGPRQDARVYVGGFEVGVPHLASRMLGVRVPQGLFARDIRVACPGDMTGDGTDDLAVGSSWSSNEGGFAALLFGPADASFVDLVAEPERADFFVIGDRASIDGIGETVVGVGDLDGNGRAEVLVTERNENDQLVKAWLFRGPTD